MLISEHTDRVICRFLSFFFSHRDGSLLKEAKAAGQGGILFNISLSFNTTCTTQGGGEAARELNLSCKGLRRVLKRRQITASCLERLPKQTF